MKILLYQTAIIYGKYAGEPIPCMKVEGNLEQVELENEVIDAYRRLEPDGDKIEIERNSHPRNYTALVPYPAHVESVDFTITRTHDGGIDLQGIGISGFDRAVDYLVNIVEDLKSKHPDLSINDQPGYLS